MSAKSFLVSLSLMLLTGCPVIPIVSNDETPTEPSADSTLKQESKFCKVDFWKMAVVPDLAEIEDPNQQCEFVVQGERIKSRLIHKAVDAIPRVFRAFLEKGPSLDARKSDGSTALTDASFKGHTEIVRALLAAGADVDLQDKNGQWTALIKASAYGHPESVRVLLEAGADVDLQAKDQVTALIAASFMGHTEIVRALLAAGADVDLQLENQATALMRASALGHPEIVRALLGAGADQHIEDERGMTVMDWARQNGHAEIIGLLREAFLQDKSGVGR